MSLRVHIVDPPAYTPPYDHALCAALAHLGGLDVTLVTGRFAHGEVPEVSGYTLDERFYRGTEHLPRRTRAVARGARHAYDMLRYRAAARREADIVHMQWLSLAVVDRALLPPGPLVFTAHNLRPRGRRPGEARATEAVLRRADAVVVHSEHGRERLTRIVGVHPDNVHVIPHGALDYLTHLSPVRPPELAPAERPVVLFFGLLRPYKGLDLLYDAWRRLDGTDAELWVVGKPWRGAPEPPAGVKTVPRFVSDAEAAWVFRHADLVALPYRVVEQSGVLLTALAFGKAAVASNVGGFREVTAVRHVEPDNAEALATAVHELLEDRGARARLAADALNAARTTYSWAASARSHADLYAKLTRS
jgi:glycosyltransferase involved in cell wall biosynthesis